MNSDSIIKLKPMALLSRRELLGRSPALIAALSLLMRRSLSATAEMPETEDNIEGPFYKPGAPFRSVFLEEGMSGIPLILSGRVLNTRGEPLKGALLDIWHADGQGQYDNEGYRLRGRLYADASGSYRLRTIKPRYYAAGNTIRPAHIHVKVSAAGAVPLTTQLYFKGDPYNGSDRWVRQSLMLSPEETDEGLKASFDFVLKVG